jgi:hypothetical protein
MSKSIRIDDKLYELVEKFAADEDRPVANALERLIKLGLGISHPTENKKVEIPNRVGSQANRVVATGNEHMPVRESLPDDLEEAVQTAMRIKQDMRPESLQAWCHKMAVDEAWTDEQCQYEIEKRKTELQEELDGVMVILREHNVNIGI